MVKFYSNMFGYELTGKIIEERKYTYKIMLEHDKIIVKKKAQLIEPAPMILDPRKLNKEQAIAKAKEVALF